MNPEVEGSDDSNIQITISRDHISHDQTHPPVATSLAVTPSGFHTIIYLEIFEF